MTQKQGGQDLKLVNRLAESRSPYVSAAVDEPRAGHAPLTRRVKSGPRTHGQPGRMAAVGSRGDRAGEETQPVDLCQYRLRCLSLYV